MGDGVVSLGRRPSWPEPGALLLSMSPQDQHWHFGGLGRVGSVCTRPGLREPQPGRLAGHGPGGAALGCGLAVWFRTPKGVAGHTGFAVSDPQSGSPGLRTGIPGLSSSGDSAVTSRPEPTGEAWLSSESSQQAEGGHTRREVVAGGGGTPEALPSAGGCSVDAPYAALSRTAGWGPGPAALWLWDSPASHQSAVRRSQPGRLK